MKVILRLLPWLVSLALIAALVGFVFIPIYSQVDEQETFESAVYFYEGGDDTVTMENDNLLFEMDPTTSHFKVTQKDSGRVWLSNPENAADDPVAIASNKDKMQATVLVTYTNSSGTVEMDNYTYSIKNTNYLIEQPEENVVTVKYAIGKIEREYMIPSAIPKDRYDMFRSQMKKSTQKKMASSYSMVSPDNIDDREDKNELIALYPEVLNQPMYILKSDVKANNKEKLEGYFEEGGYTREEYEYDLQFVAGTRKSNGPVFNVTVTYRLTENDLVVEVPYSELTYRAEYPLTSLTVLPMFGATTQEDEGYIFVPEAGGALIHYNNGKLAQGPYYANVYGWDYATYRSEVVNETNARYPVFGMNKEGGSFLCMLEGATSYASIRADISMRNNAYNWVHASHVVLHSDKYNVSTKTSDLVYMYEKQIPNDTVVQRYRFIEDDSYVAMATEYGKYLRANPLMSDSKASEAIPVTVELVGAIDKTVVKFGLPIDSTVAVTTFDQAGEIVQDLKDGGVDNLHVRMSGWVNGGITQRVFTKLKPVRVLGGQEGMNQLIQLASEKNVPLYFEGISCFAYDSGIFEGFIPYMNAARYATREQVKIFPYSLIIFLSQSDDNDPFYLVKPAFAKAGTDNLLAHLKQNGAYGVAFRDIGNLLSGDYNSRDNVTREQVKAMNIQSMTEAKEGGQHVMVRSGNDYTLPYTDVISDMCLVGNTPTIVDEVVPFYQIALHGLKDYTGEPLNLSGDYQQELLRSAEYGSGLNFTFIAEDAKILQDTTHSTLYGANYTAWRTSVLETITRYQTEMKGLNQLMIVNHERNEYNVSVTTYEDGTQVFVNYGNVGRSIDGVYIPARDYTVKRGDSK